MNKSFEDLYAEKYLAGRQVKSLCQEIFDYQQTIIDKMTNCDNCKFAHIKFSSFETCDNCEKYSNWQLKD